MPPVQRELADILDPWENPRCSGPHLLPSGPHLGFPGETFRVLKQTEGKTCGESRTRRSVQAAWERLKSVPPRAFDTHWQEYHTMATQSAVKAAAGRLRAVMAWAKTNLPEYEEIIQGQQEVLARYQPSFALDAIPSLTEDEFRSFLLFESNHHWPLHRQGSRICADMDRLREALTILVDDSRPIEERLGKLLPKAGASMVPYLGRAVITAILMVVAPDRWGVWNNRSEASLKRLGVFPDLPSSAPFAERYLSFNAILTQLAAEVGVDLWTLDFLHYALERHEEIKPPGGGGVGEEDDLTETEGGPAVSFGLEQHLHDFMRDNWDMIPLGSDWTLLEQDGEVVGYKYQTGEIGEIDLLARHKSEPRWLVIELKRNQTSDATVGQVLRYVGWVEEHLAGEGETVEGLIIAQSMDERIRYALKHTRGLSLKLYEIEFRLKEPGS